MAAYLVDEVLSRLPADMSEFLRTISICEQISAYLAARLSGRADAATLLDAIAEQTSLVVRVDAAPHGYHVHALLRSHLLADLVRLDPGRAANLHGVAADWYAQRGEPAHQFVAWTRERVGDVAELGLMRAWTAFWHGDLYSTEPAVHAVLDDPGPTLCAMTPVDARLLETALEMRLGRRTKALGALNAALEHAEPGSLIRPFRHAELPVRQLLLEQVGGFGRLNGFAARVSQLVSIMDVPPVEVLTNREHAVLVRLSSPRSLDELASDMSVSVNTVKTHVRAIYAKLGVNNRRAAVIAARRLGLDGAGPPFVAPGVVDEEPPVVIPAGSVR